MAGVFVGVCEWPRRARVEKVGMELRVQQQHGGWDVEPSYASYEASLPGRGRRGASIVFRPWREGKHGGALDSQL